MDDNDPYIIAFNKIVTCLPIHNYVINSLEVMITYYCGLNNIFTISLDILFLPPFRFQQDRVRRFEAINS
jgi:hypothetical protein